MESTFCYIELARRVLASVESLRTPPWSSRDSWRALRKSLQRRIAFDVEHLLDDVWDAIPDNESTARWLLELAISDVACTESNRAMRSVAPPCLIDAVSTQWGFDAVGRMFVAGDRLGDAHVHAGGAVPFEDVVNSLLSESARPHLTGWKDPDPSSRQDAHGARVAVAPLVGGVLLTLSELAPQGWQASAWSWSEVADIAQSGDADAVRQLIDRVPIGFQSSWMEVKAAVQRRNVDRHRQDGLIIALCVLHSSITTSDVASLDLFTTDFRGYPVFWAEPERFRAAVLFMSPPLDRLELRKAVGPIEPMADTPIPALSRLFADAALVSRGANAIQMPITFIKRPGKPGDPFLLDSQLRLAEYYLDALVELGYPGRQLISSVDVAGYELTQPNHVFIAAFQLISRGLAARNISESGVTYSAHAGESFEHPLGGLRCIDEFATFLPQISRLGHCLALDVARAGDLITALTRVRARADMALLDLCWSRHKLGAIWNGALDTFVGELAASMFEPLRPTADDAMAWYLRLFELDTAIKYREVPAAPCPPGSVTDMCHSGESTVDRMLHAYFHPSCHHGVRVRRPEWVDQRISGSIQAARSVLYYSLHEAVRTSLVSRITIECCPTSNARTGRFTAREHPISAFKKAWNLSCTISSDDPGLFSTSLEDEYVAAVAAGLDTNDRAEIIGASHAGTAATLKQPAREVYIAVRGS